MMSAFVKEWAALTAQYAKAMNKLSSAYKDKLERASEKSPANSRSILNSFSANPKQMLAKPWAQGPSDWRTGADGAAQSGAEGENARGPMLVSVTCLAVCDSVRTTSKVMQNVFSGMAKSLTEFDKDGRDHERNRLALETQVRIHPHSYSHQFRIFFATFQP
jgi:hypothetical protein